MFKQLKNISFCVPISKSSRHSSSLSYRHNIGEPLKFLTIGQLLENTVKKHGETKAIISKKQNRSITFKEVLEEADKLAAGLKKLGNQKGNRVGIWAPNLIEWTLTKMACARAGFILVALNPLYQPSEIQYCINKVGVKTIVTLDSFKTQNYYDILNTVDDKIFKSEPGKLNSSVMPSLKNIVTITDKDLRGTFNFEQILRSSTISEVEALTKNKSDVQPDDPCNIQFTSGTTGNPKAAYLSHFTMVNNSYFIGKRNGQDVKHMKICVQVPLFHAFGTVISTMSSLNFGSTMVFPSEGYSPNDSLTAIKEEKCNMIHGTPTMYVDLIKKQQERNEIINPEIAVSGGAPCSPHLFKQMLEVLGVKKVKSVFGLTETTAVVFQSMPDDDAEKSTQTVGFIHEHVEAKVVDKDNKIVPCGTPGELYIRGYLNMLGYWGDEEKTKEAMGPDRWFKTGDRFILEENGYGRIVGRFKEMIIRGGENIAPREIEDCLNTHPDIIETHVVGIPDERLGEEVCACIRIKEGTDVTKDNVSQFLKGKLASYKIPKIVQVVEAFPKTTSGKIQKYKLIENIVKKLKACS